MDCTATYDRDMLEKKLHDPTAPPIDLPVQFLVDITCNFSRESELGRGGYGVVYKGVLSSGKIVAVKKIFDKHLVDDDQFQKEVSYLMDIKHQNIVQLVGYCAESRWEAIDLPSGTQFVELPKRLLCFEYLRNESLDKYVSDESSGLDWYKRFEIIKGICNGLQFLHEKYIVHLDLKPKNILMDASMMPKVTDFGLSRLLGAEKSRTVINGNLVGSLGYMAPEFISQGIVSPKADIFSFGVIIIEIITGCRDYPLISTVPYLPNFYSQQSIEISQQQYIENVLERWGNIFQKEPKYTSPEIYTQQVKDCITIALKCLDYDSTRRPNAWDIFQMLSAVESTNCHAKEIKDSCVCQEKLALDMQCEERLVVLKNCTSNKELSTAVVTEDMLNKETTGEVVDKLKSEVLYESESQPSSSASMTSTERSLAIPQSKSRANPGGWAAVQSLWSTESQGCQTWSTKSSTAKQNDKKSPSQSQAGLKQQTGCSGDYNKTVSSNTPDLMGTTPNQSLSLSIKATNKSEDSITQISCDQKTDLLSVKPQKLHFHWTLNNLFSSCSLHLTNNTDDTVAFRILTKNPAEYYFFGPLYGIVLPRSMCTLQVAACKRFDDELFTLESTKYHGNESPDNWKQCNSLFKNANKDKGCEVQQVNIPVVTGHEPGNMIIQKYPNAILCIAVHPTETWIVISNTKGFCTIWNYSTQETVSQFQIYTPWVLYLPAIFIAQKQWLVVGDPRGHINVYSTNTMEQIDRFKAHDGDITSLDIHPAEPYVLSASNDRLIKLWCWEMGWKCLRTFDTFQLRNFVKFNPKSVEYFTNVAGSMDEVQIWNTGSSTDKIQISDIGSSSCEFRTTARRFCTPIDYFTRGNQLYFIMGHGDGSATASGYTRLWPR